MSGTCSYSNCRYKALPGEKYCIFHAPSDKKGCSIAEFNQKMMQLLASHHDPNLEGFVFPGGISFAGQRFLFSPIFKDAKFHGHADFSGLDCRVEANFENAIFEDGVNFKSAVFPQDVSFRGATFSRSIESDQTPGPCFNGRECVFAGLADFTGAKFLVGDADFSEANFGGIKAVFKNCRFDVAGRISFLAAEFSVRKTNFDGAILKADTIDFEGCKFHEGRVSYFKSTFSAREVKFNGAKFSGDVVRFNGCNFSRGTVSFDHSEFGANVDFCEAKFAGESVHFAGCQFGGDTVSFVGTEIMAKNVGFSRCRFSGDVEFRENSVGQDLRFEEAHFLDRAAFRFSMPTFVKCGESPPRIVFSRTNFNPFNTFFENVHPTGAYAQRESIQRPCVIFRYCSLKDVYFSNNDMGLFSFFGSVFFEEAHLVSNKWLEIKDPILRVLPIRHRRKNQILEEHLYEVLRDEIATDEDKTRLRDRFELRLLRSRTDVEAMYRKFKTSSDRSKDYHAASRFYFNEFEMKRRHLKDSLEQASSAWQKLAIRGRLWLYSSFKVFAGYGDKPFWSLAWFLLLTFIFSVLHLVRGIQVPGHRVIDYDVGLHFPDLPQLIPDMLYSLVFSLYHIIPVSYLPYQRTEYAPLQLGLVDLALSFFNTVVLLLLIIFIGIGLKRHFRRF